MWRPNSADVVWDPDFNPEGLSQSVRMGLLGGDLSLNALQSAVDEDSGSEADQYLFSTQLLYEHALGDRLGLRFAGSWHEWVNERQSTFGQPSTNEGNRRTTTGNVVGALANDFAVGEVSTEFHSKIADLPLRVQGTFIKNTAHLSARRNAGDTAREDIGYQVGTIIGRARKARSWEAAYFYKWVETDATVADIADSDFGDGGTNRRGHILWAGYSPRDWIQFRVRYFYTQVIDENLTPGTDDINRTQVDLALRF